MATNSPDLFQVMPPADGVEAPRGVGPTEGIEASVAADRETLVDLYRRQVLARTFDEKAVRLNRQGRLGTYAPLAGHEAIQVGAVHALAETDWLLPTYRDHAMYLERGFAVEDVLTHLLGRGNYVDEAAGEVRTFPPVIPVATQVIHATGIGMGADYMGDAAAALVSFGDGATSEGDFHEGMNMAGVFDAPVVFLCQNNQYAISVPYRRQTASPTIAGKAAAYGFEGIRVDGTDVLAVADAVSSALTTARTGEGPTLIEAMTYRRGAHTTADDPERYRPDDEGAEWPDPVERTRSHLRARHGWTDDEEATVREWATARVAEAIDAVEAEGPPVPESMFDSVYDGTDPRLAAQRDRLVDDPEIVR